MTGLHIGRRLTIAGGFALAAAAPMLATVMAASPAVPGQLAACPSGEDSDLYSGTCVPYLVPNTASPVNNACPPGVSGAECTGSTGNLVPPHPAPPKSPELQELENVVTPGY
ncbi:hypothetical protein [Mycolicibacterium celeriflavum]|uniref:hypothetical protein n=1 Tax=Mycolicibacterium celeriflavum TaxID=1249101 RepID=UPI003CFB682C